MFDFRYHVASLAAVFLALIIGILVGVGVSGTGFVKDSERDRLNRLIDDARADRDAARTQRDALAADARAADVFIEEAYPLLMGGRLRGERIAVVSIGAVPTSVADAVGRVLTDADASLVRTVVLTMPGDMSRVTAALTAKPALEGKVGRWGTIGSDVGKQLARGQDDLLAALEPLIVQERTGSAALEVDGVVVVGPVPAQADTPRAQFLRGLYGGLGDSAVGAAVEAREERPGTVAGLAPYGFATIDDVDTRLGRVALAGVLSADAATVRGKRYGVKPTADDGPLPPLEPVLPQPGG
jgi:hypothetical protein